MQNLSGRTFAVTGGSGNLGAAVADALVAAGANVATLDRSHPAPAGERILRLGGLDLTDAGAVAGALDEAARHFGALDGLVATVGGFAMGGSAEADGWGVWEAMLGANLKTAVAAIQAAAPRLPEGRGRIVTVGARAGQTGPAGLAAYAAAKGALLRLTESLADELKERGVTVNAVLPGIIDTPQNRAAMPGADTSRWVPPADIAAVVAFLLSDAARAVTGALIPVSGRG